MSASENNEVLGRSLYAMWNERAFDKIAALTAEYAEIVITATGQRFKGPAGMREYCAGWAAAFPDGQVEVTNLVASEGGYAAEFIGRGTHTGPLSTPMGDIPPTQRRMEIAYCEVHEVRNGKLAGVRLYFDTATLMRQLGLLPEPSQAARG